jgi:hypothetical protein
METDKLEKVRAAGTLRADEVWTQNGWRKAPAQCPIFCEVIKGATSADIHSMLDAWIAAYHTRCNQYADAALIDLFPDRATPPIEPAIPSHLETRTDTIPLPFHRR